VGQRFVSNNIPLVTAFIKNSNLESLHFFLSASTCVNAVSCKMTFTLQLRCYMQVSELYTMPLASMNRHLLPILICVKAKSVHERFEVFTAVTMKDGVFWDVTPCGSCKNRCMNQQTKYKIISN
jgi:hypothetical protein